jgi:hypothetical protein
VKDDDDRCVNTIFQSNYRYNTIGNVRKGDAVLGSRRTGNCNDCNDRRRGHRLNNVLLVDQIISGHVIHKKSSFTLSSTEKYTQFPFSLISSIHYLETHIVSFSHILSPYFMTSEICNAITFHPKAFFRQHMTHGQ